jgi:hypothetical protein
MVEVGSDPNTSRGETTMRGLSTQQLAFTTLASAFVIAGACGSERTAPGKGSGGVRQTGGAVPGGGGIVGSGGAVPANPETGVGGSGAGGSATGGSGLVGSGAGGVAGTGGKATGGAGGIIALDAGCTGASCAKDAAPGDGNGSSCIALTSTECSLRNDCHAVFARTTNCSCTEDGCCMAFDHCAGGNTADCIGPALCKSMPPSCEGAYYTPEFKDGCYEGCVVKHVCTRVCPKAPQADKSACGPVDHPCIYDDCAGKGRTLATCAGGTWSTQTTACGAATCEGVGVTPSSVTCSPGQVCVRTSGSNVVTKVKPTCVDNTCGTNPISVDCLGGVSGACEVQSSATGGSIYCVLPPPCQGAGGCDYSYF